MPALLDASPAAAPRAPLPGDYRLTGDNTRRAIVQGLAEATWYQCPVEPATMRSLLVRENWPGIRDTVLWLALLGATATAGIMLWGSWWAILPFALYGVLYGSTSDSRWHESSHGTAFRSDWLNHALYELASFMVMRESTLWRWSHTRHHSDTIIVGRDPEIAFPRPTTGWDLFLGFFGIGAAHAYVRKLLRHAGGALDADEQTYVPRDQWQRVVWTARVHLAIYAGVIATAVFTQSLLPLVLIGLPNIYGAWLMPIYGGTQHAGLAENVLDHRLNCRTVRMNWLNRFLYWNMNYHVEHHMFPLVPYHQLPRLHAAVASDMPTPYASLWAAWREIIPALRKQRTDRTYCVQRPLPAPTHAATPTNRALVLHPTSTADGWLDVGPVTALEPGSVARVDHGQQTLAIYRTANGSCHATDGLCSHGRVHLAEGLVSGNLIECPKHNGRFDLRDGTAKRAPACAGIAAYPVREEAGRLLVDPRQGKTIDAARSFRVVSNANLTAYIKELVIEPLSGPALAFTPGDYLRVVIPAYERRAFAEFDITSEFADTWSDPALRSVVATNPREVRRNYSLANAPAEGRQLRFNVRLAVPANGSDQPAGVGSAYVWSLKPGDVLAAAGPFGEFHVKPGPGEMVYIGGGAGMAPPRAHLAQLLEVEGSPRRISFWYGARGKKDLFYVAYFEELARRFSNFSFHVALSQPAPGDPWHGRTGYIHQVVEKQLLHGHSDPTAIDFYLCGPPGMIQAVQTMLQGHGVSRQAIAFDEF